ncbi:hypothetical protein [Agrococcus sp. Ld7]|uniref:hypothetical protein n=1 Tax=Agrococcus sp. Ld7 TaxID=649148 RepID=UPI00386A004C
MTTQQPATPLEIERDFTEQRDWGIRFLVVAGLAAWLLSGAFGSSGGGGGETGPSWSVVVQVMPAVQGAVLGMIALGWLVTQWQRHDRHFVLRVRRLVLLTAWALVGVAIVGSYAALFFVDRPPSTPPVVYFPLELVDVAP